MWIGKFRIYKEKPKVISVNAIWVFIDYYKSYMYENESLFKLLCTIITEWRHDRHLVG